MSWCDGLRAFTIKWAIGGGFVVNSTGADLISQAIGQRSDKVQFPGNPSGGSCCLALRHFNHRLCLGTLNISSVWGWAP